MIEERCGTTELFVSQCGCPKHRGGLTVDEENAVIRRILLRNGWRIAVYPSICGRCRTPFEPGAAIRSPQRGESGWIAECCAGASVDLGSGR